MSDPNYPQPDSFPAPGQPATGGFVPPSPPGAGYQPPQPPFGGAPTAPSFGQPAFGQPPQPAFGQSPQPAQPAFGQPPSGQSGDGPVVGEQPKSKRSRGKMIAAIGGVAAVLGAGVFAVTQLRDNDSAGGAANAEDLGTELVAALNNEDILGAVDLLLPGERDTFRQPMLDLVSELKRLEVLDGSADLGSVGGFDIQIDDPTVTVRNTTADDIKLVRVEADSTVTVNGKDLPIGEFLLDTAFGGDQPDFDEESDDPFEPQFAAVERDGKWYISLFYSAAVGAAGADNVPSADEAVQPEGADSPEAALDNVIQSIVNLDLERIIANLNPNEAEALQRFAPLFVEEGQELFDRIDIVWDLTEIEYAVHGSGDTRQVGVASFAGEVQVDEQTIVFEFKDGCFTVSTPDGNFDSCGLFSDQSDTTLDDFFDQSGFRSGQIRDVLDNITTALADIDFHGVVVDKVNGKWFVSPIGTGSEAFLSVLRALDREELETLVNDFRGITESAFPGMTVPEIPYPDDTIPYDTVPDDTIPGDTIPGDTDPDVSIPDAASWTDCLFESDAAAVSSCVSAGVQSGEFEASYIPPAFIFPDCGLAEYYWNDTIYEDDAATFLATIEPGRQCILDGAAGLGIDLLYSGPEFLYPDCFAQDNPYNYDEANEVDGYTCAYSQS